MNEKIIGVVLLFLVIFIFYRFLKWLLGPKHVSPMSEEEALQHQILNGIDKMPPLPREDKPSCVSRLFFVIIIIVIILACLLAYKGGFDFHPFR